MRVTDIIQGSKEWHQFRRTHIGASDASIIMGLNPWRSISQLWEEKIFGWEQETNDKMKAGNEMEHEARKCYQSLTNLCVNPLVCEDEIYPFLSASFDGITEDLSHAVEIKCGKGSHRMASNGRIPAICVNYIIK